MMRASIAEPQQVAEDAAHQPIDRCIPIRSCGKDLLPGLDVWGRHQFVTAIGDELPGRFRRCFKVELQADHRSAELECLVFAPFALCQPYRSRGEIEGLTVPVKHRCRGREPENRTVAGVNRMDGKSYSLKLFCQGRPGARVLIVETDIFPPVAEPWYMTQSASRFHASRSSPDDLRADSLRDCSSCFYLTSLSPESYTLHIGNPCYCAETTP